MAPRSTAAAPRAPRRTNPCLRANNLTTGSAFEFNTVGGESAGRITAGAGGDSKRPFTTNATGDDVRNNGIHAQIAIQNNDTIADPTELSGETGTAPCGATFVTCAPPGTEDNEVLVVAPRQSDGAATTAGARLRFYVYVTGSQAG